MDPLNKLEAIFNKAGWLKESDNVVHLPITGLAKEENLTWKDLYFLLQYRILR